MKFSSVALALSIVIALANAMNYQEMRDRSPAIDHTDIEIFLEPLFLKKNCRPDNSTCP